MDYFMAYRKVWQFHKQYIDKVSNDDEFWEAVIESANELYKEYNDSRFVKDLILAEMNEFERISKEKT